MNWMESHRFDKRALPIANRHYNRQKPESPQFVPPGGCAVFLTPDEDALWVTSTPMAEYVRHEWPGAWVNSLFRNEGFVLSSELIRDAVAASRFVLGDPPPQGIVSFIDPSKTRRKRDPGRCYIKAGWHYLGLTKGGLVAVGLPADEFPAPIAPLGLLSMALPA
jgi:hypothetical protein